MHRVLLIACLSVAVAACSEQPAESEENGDLLEQAAETSDDAEAADSIEVLDDERSVARRVQDATIAAQVRIALVEARDLRPFDFNPIVANGRVLLQGEVRTQEQRRRAESVAAGVSGVRDVVNEISALEQPEIAEADTAPADTGSSAEPDTAGEQTPATAESEAESPDETEETYHTVRSGESLWRIARQYGTTVDQIRGLNNLSSSSIKPGQRLRVE